MRLLTILSVCLIFSNFSFAKDQDSMESVREFQSDFHVGFELDHVIDGDTIVADGIKIRLWGIDAITDFIQITDNGNNSIVSVDIDGGADNFVHIATLIDIIGLTDETALETSGNLITI